MASWLFSGWSDLARIALLGPAIYVVLIVMLRVSGKRSLSKFTAFDLVVTVALGSLLASVLLDRTVSLATGAAAIGMLVALQWLVAALAVRSERVRQFAASEPALVYWRGEYCLDAMRRERITEANIRAAIRAADVEPARAMVVLEANGDLSVTASAHEFSPSAGT